MTSVPRKTAFPSVQIVKRAILIAHKKEKAHVPEEYGAAMDARITQTITLVIILELMKMHHCQKPTIIIGNSYNWL